MKNFTFGFLFASVLFAIACSTPKINTKFDGNWQFYEVTPGENWACLPQADVAKLKEVLVRCHANSGN